SIVVCAFKDSAQKKAYYFNGLRLLLNLKCQSQVEESYHADQNDIEIKHASIFASNRIVQTLTLSGFLGTFLYLAKGPKSRLLWGAPLLYLAMLVLAVVESKHEIAQLKESSKQSEAAFYVFAPPSERLLGGTITDQKIDLEKLEMALSNPGSPEYVYMDNMKDSLSGGVGRIYMDNASYKAFAAVFEKVGVAESGDITHYCKVGSKTPCKSVWLSIRKLIKRWFISEDRKK
ncbi:MAG: hypothetical protein OXC44_01465, partial [Proteobacteria bacterium]|nr:hypothetical protein [Pseudomonadota bacterium]